MDTWGIRSATFVVIYAGVLALTALIVFVLRRRVRGASDRDGLVGVSNPEIDPYEAAMLTGGEKLVLATAACRLLESGALRTADGADVLVIAGVLPAQSRPVERWVYATVEGHASGVGRCSTWMPQLASCRRSASGFGRSGCCWGAGSRA